MSLYFKKDNITLYCGDSFDILNNIDHKFNFILADIPYIISQNNNFATMKDRKGRNGIDFGVWDNIFDLNKLSILSNFIETNGSIIVFHSFEQYCELKKIFEDNGLECKDRIIWQKTNPMPRNRDRRYISNCELGSWYIKQKNSWIFNRQNDKYESMVMSYPSESGGGFKRYHPTQKSLKLFEKLIKIHSNENDIILDPFAGSGTTGIACMNTNRNCVLIEKEEKYCEVIKQRICNNVMQGDLL